MLSHKDILNKDKQKEKKDKETVKKEKVKKEKVKKDTEKKDKVNKEKVKKDKVKKDKVKKDKVHIIRENNTTKSLIVGGNLIEFLKRITKSRKKREEEENALSLQREKITEGKRKIYNAELGNIKILENRLLNNFNKYQENMEDTEKYSKPVFFVRDNKYRITAATNNKYINNGINAYSHIIRLYDTIEDNKEQIQRYLY